VSLRDASGKAQIKRMNIVINSMNKFLKFVLTASLICNAFAAIDNPSNNFSSLSQINKDNIKSLRTAWIFHSGEFGKGAMGIQTKPVYAEGLLFTTSHC